MESVLNKTLEQLIDDGVCQMQLHQLMHMHKQEELVARNQTTETQRWHAWMMKATGSISVKKDRKIPCYSNLIYPGCVSLACNNACKKTVNNICNTGIIGKD